ncbi:MAG: hypothetical protein Q7S83_02850 [bacterium]|nr:hypothetical protein [bacterium]
MENEVEVTQTFYPKKFNWKGWAITAGTFVLFVVAYSTLLEWKAALMFSVFLFIHEMGHLVLCWRKKAMATPPIFIPFIGALIKIDPTKFTTVDEAEVGYGGPFWGSVAAAVGMLIWTLLPSHPEFLLWSSAFALALNFINLVPLRPLDGGRITQVISGWFRYLGLLVVLAVVIFVPANPALWLVVALIIYGQDENGLLFKGAATLLIGAAMVVMMSFAENPAKILWALPVFLGYLHLSTVSNIYKLWKFKNKLSQLEDEKKLTDIADWRNRADALLYGAQKPLPSVRVRLKWLAYYLLLAVMLLALMYWAFASIMAFLQQ